MQLKSLLTKIPAVLTVGSTDREITSICYDSRRVQKGSLFVAVPGEKVDGSSFIEAAIDKGAVAVVTEREQVQPRATLIVVPSARAALADLASEYYGRPSLGLKVAGITGTNGKTTTAFLIKHLCDAVQQRAGLVSTIRYEIGERILPAPRTTPESLDLQEIFFQIRSAGCRAVAMEVSSHALELGRTRGVEFDTAIFTNLTQDHLDYHKTMEAYFEAKWKLFVALAGQQHKKGKAVVNIDDRWGQRLISRLTQEYPNLPLITYGMNARADFRAGAVRTDLHGSQYQLDAQGKTYLVRLPLIGAFNVYNSLAALAGAAAIGVDLRTAVRALADAPSVPGRLQPVPVKRQFRVFVDYAHTDDALQNVMKTLRDLGPRRLIVVFGCGGNRDKAKRPLMAAAVERGADWAIVTSDNPRKENPADIIAEVQTGFRNKAHEAIEDRKEAIFRAISLAGPRDIVLIAGKGHETTQEFADHTIPFDDLSIARQAVEARPVDMED
ncbi:MAG: UDP-N-acetylmuramoyl-L-alanyl-D-glutamate--2,6-diaminopimelate ligase [Chthoniobacteraceae bacterium]